MKITKLVVAMLVVAAIQLGHSRARAADGFDVVALGALGGIEDGNLSAWLVHPHGDDRAVTCDAGALVNRPRSSRSMPSRISRPALQRRSRTRP